MSLYQELLKAALPVQANAQANVPVTPNNGNPGGAYNAPRPAVPAAQPTLPGRDFSWLQPSSSMQQLHQMLQNRQQYLDTRLGEIRQPQQLQQVQQPQQVQMPRPPQLPQYSGSVFLPQQMSTPRFYPTMPQQVPQGNTGIVPPGGIPNVTMPLARTA